MDVDFERRAAARPIASGSYTPDGDTKATICISPDRSVVAVGSGRTLTFFAVILWLGLSVDHSHLLNVYVAHGRPSHAMGYP